MDHREFKPVRDDVAAYCVGDYIHDEWVPVEVSRVTPDAPAPVWDRTGPAVTAPGGTGNVAMQFKPLTRDITVVTAGVPRIDLRARGFTDLAVPTAHVTAPIKTRYCANGHILARVDTRPTISRQNSDAAVVEAVRVDLASRKVVNGLTREGKSVVAVLSDYAAGFWSESLARQLVDVFRYFGVYTIVDPKPKGVPLRAWDGASALKLNAAEARHYADHRALIPAADLVRARTGRTVVVTDGGRPPVFTAPGIDPCHVGRCHESPEPLWASGAGDCFAAHLAYQIAVGARVISDADVATAHDCAAAYVHKPYSTPVHPREGRERSGDLGAKIYARFDELAGRIAALPPGARVGYTNGVFDLLHCGHVHCLHWARQQCDFLVAFVNSDAGLQEVNRTATLTARERCAALAGLASVSAVVPFDGVTPDNAFAALGRCDVLVKGPDYAHTEPAGAAFADEVRFAPAVEPIHATHIRERIVNRGPKNG